MTKTIAAADASASRADLHARLRRIGAAWLFCEERVLLVAEEYSLGGGRCADVLGMTDARRVVPSSKAARLAYPELTSKERRGPDKRNVEIPTDAHFRLIEVKASRADFIVGLRKGQIANDGQGLGTRADYCYLLCPWGVAWPEELPPRWGLLWYWDGPTVRVHYCTSEHADEPEAHVRKRVRIPAAAVPDLPRLLPGATHILVRKARSFHTLQGQTRHHLFRAAPARRLAPSAPLRDRAAVHRAAIIQSAFWRLYR